MTPGLATALEPRAAAHQTARASGRPERPARNEALDFTKGSLVLIMVLYHWLNYFVILQADVYRYLRFLTPSFILITGFIVSHVYLAKPLGADRQLYSRLLIRGVKILLLFVLLNVGANLVAPHTLNLADLDAGGFARYAYGVFVTGSGRAVFDVLIPIGYFLLLAPAIVLASTRFGVSLHVVAAAALLAALVTNAAGIANPNLELLSIAMLGMAVGTLPIARINRTLDRPLLLLVAYAMYLVAITWWNVLFPLQVVGVSLSLLLIYLAGMKWGSTGVLQRHVIELGKYSLFAYIAQIVFLQVLRRVFRDVDLQGALGLIPLVATLTLTVASVEVMSLVRNRSAAVDRMYRVVFA